MSDGSGWLSSGTAGAPRRRSRGGGAGSAVGVGEAAGALGIDRAAGAAVRSQGAADDEAVAQGGQGRQRGLGGAAGDVDRAAVGGGADSPEVVGVDGLAGAAAGDEDGV